MRAANDIPSEGDCIQEYATVQYARLVELIIVQVEQ